MNIYKITVLSNCGSHFAAYLQQVTVCAESKEAAIAAYEKWEKDNYSFIRKPTISDVEEIKVVGGVIDFAVDSDY